VTDGNWQRRQALQIAAMLPDNPADALLVLGYARVLVERYLQNTAAPGTEGNHAVVDFPDSATSRRRTRSRVIPSKRPR
jgi:hypothetical protein